MKLMNDCTGSAFLVAAKARLERTTPKAPGLVILDPPWPYESGPVKGSAKEVYELMSLDDILLQIRAMLPIKNGKAHYRVLLWVTNAFLVDVVTGMAPTIKEANLRACGALAVVYPSKKGVGWHCRGNSEIGLIFTAGNPQCDPAYAPDSGFVGIPEETPEQHSAKPLSSTKGVIKGWTTEDSPVVIPYLGSGVELLACCETRRYNVISAEINENRRKAAINKIWGSLTWGNKSCVRCRGVGWEPSAILQDGSYLHECAECGG